MIQVLEQVFISFHFTLVADFQGALRIKTYNNNLIKAPKTIYNIYTKIKSKPNFQK